MHFKDVLLEILLSSHAINEYQATLGISVARKSR
jgi:hypothetical protein